MEANLKDILSHLSTEVDQETLLLYLQGKLTAEKQHELEKQMLVSDFETDALEGLQNFKNDQRLQFVVEQLNRDLKKRTQKKKAAKEKFQLKNEPWLYIAIFIILLLIIISYVIMHQYLRR